MSQQQLPESNLAHSILFKVSLILLIALFINVITQMIQIINIVESFTFNENEPRKNVHLRTAILAGFFFKNVFELC